MTLHWPGPNQSFSVPALCAQSSFILDGTTPFSNDQQNSRLRNGARMSTLAFNMAVAAGRVYTLRVFAGY